ncbi:MAG: outer membrane beta-barrel protein, partial [Bacteroidota bacterium]
GRTVYSPLFGGVYWDAQNVLQEDIKQIEVISGPGGSLWGANAVNGIVNVISKTAKESQGLYASAAGGFQPRDFGAIRYGSHIDTTLYYRVYAQRFDFNNTTLNGGIDAKDAWNMSQGGFRMDYYPGSKNTFTFQGDLYKGKEDDSASTYINGQNMLGRWTYNYSENSNFAVQAYYDRTYRNITRQVFKDELNTFDIDLQHNLSTGKRNKFVWGLGYRLDADNISNITNSILPAVKTLHLFSGFLQDQFTIIANRLDLTLGTKVLHNDYTSFELQPTVRLAYTPNSKNTVWASASRAVRTPSRFDGDNPSSPDFDSEVLIAYELGYRVRPAKNILLSLATYYNNYNNLRSIDSSATPPPTFYFGNHLEANTYGIEFSANAVLLPWWKLRGGYTWLHEEFETTSPITYPLSKYIEAIDPSNQFLVQSLMDIGKHFQFDGTARYVDALPQAITQPAVPAYFTFDLRFAFIYNWITVSVTGTNLAQENHGSSGSVKIPRSGFAKISVIF